MPDAMWNSQGVLKPPTLSGIGCPGCLLEDCSKMLGVGKALCRSQFRALSRFQEATKNDRSLCLGVRNCLYRKLGCVSAALRLYGPGHSLTANVGRQTLKPPFHAASRKLFWRHEVLRADLQSFKLSVSGRNIGRPALCSCAAVCPVDYRPKQAIQYLRDSKIGYPLHEPSPVRRSTRREAVVDQASTETNLSGLLKQGALMEVDKEPGKTLLAVVRKRDGKKNWIAEDQFGNTFSVKPQQIAYVVPGVENFEPSAICSFVEKVEGLEDAKIIFERGMQDLTLLEMAWEEVLELDVTVSVTDLAKMLYVQANPVECYAAHRMLSSSQLYFRCKQKGHPSLYEPRTTSEVGELMEQKSAEEAQRHEFLNYVKSIKTVLAQPLHCKERPTNWDTNQRLQSYRLALESFALEKTTLTTSQKKMAEEVLTALEMHRSPTAATDLLVGMSIFPKHVNLELLKGAARVGFSEQLITAAQALSVESTTDEDVARRVDLRHLKVYTIDSEDTVEIDDGLSAMRLPDGSLKVWIHVADPTRWLSYDHPLIKEARYRSTSIYLPTETIPMFPMHLAAGSFSLVQGQECCALTFSVVLRDDGSVAEYEIMNSIICPTYKMSYDHVMELLSLSVEEEKELYLLAEAALVRGRWRKLQGSVDVDMPDVVVKVTEAEKPEPIIQISILDHSLPAFQLVAEMMILCGEIASAFGEKQGLPLPYRGQAAREIPKEEIEGLPEGPCRAMALIRFLGRAEVNYNTRVPHASLGLPGYVQVTSPIRRFGDLMAHYQIKAALRQESPPFKGFHIEAAVTMSSLNIKEAKRLQNAAKRYWTIEYLRRLPRHTRHEALLLRVGKDDPTVLLLKVGLQCLMPAVGSAAVGQRFFVLVERADPRKDILEIRRAP